jgi:PAS domain S-box-containing protein
VTDELGDVDAARLRDVLRTADDPAVVRAAHVALERRRGATIETLSDRYGRSPAGIRDLLDTARRQATDGDDGDEGPDPAADAGGAGGYAGVESIVDAAPLALVSLLADGSVASWNDTATELFGWHESEVIGRSVPFLTADARPEWLTLRDRVRDGEVVTDVPLQVRTVDGVVREVSAAAAPLDDDDGGGLVAAFVDETSRREREQRLEVLNRVLRHNVRNDLNVILSSAQHAVELTDDEDVAVTVQRVVDVGGSLVALSEKARDIERVIEGRHPLRMLDVVDLVTREVERVRDAHPSATVEIEAPDRETAYAIDGLETAVENLLVNAVEHHPDDPHVVVTVATVREDGDRWVEITVADDGPGIPYQEREAVLAGDESDLHHGSGLGLWLVNWIVERSNGRLRFDESDLGGAAVTIRLRRADEAL